MSLLRGKTAKKMKVQFFFKRGKLRPVSLAPASPQCSLTWRHLPVFPPPQPPQLPATPLRPWAPSTAEGQLRGDLAGADLLMHPQCPRHTAGHTACVGLRVPPRHEAFRVLCSNHSHAPQLLPTPLPAPHPGCSCWFTTS